MPVASKVWNLPSEFGHAKPLGSRIIRYVRDGRTDGRTYGQKQCLSPPSLRAGPKIYLRPSTGHCNYMNERVIKHGSNVVADDNTFLHQQTDTESSDDKQDRAGRSSDVHLISD